MASLVEVLARDSAPSIDTVLIQIMNESSEFLFPGMDAENKGARESLKTESPAGSYFGGKNGAGVSELLINNIPKHRSLIVPFAGHCAVTRKIKRCDSTVLFDQDPFVVSWWLNRNFKAIHGCGIEFLEKQSVNDLETFIFVDPPYPHSTRGKTRYKFEMTDEDHVRLLDALNILSPVANIMLCTYDNDLYQDKLSSWNKFTYESMTRSGQKKTETAYVNYDIESLPLHDYRYLGKNKREREKLKRREVNMIEKINRMPNRERERYLERIRKEFFDQG